MEAIKIQNKGIDVAEKPTEQPHSETDLMLEQDIKIRLSISESKCYDCSKWQEKYQILDQQLSKSQQTISQVRQENRNLKARIRQIESGVIPTMKQSESDEDTIYEVEKIIARKIENGKELFLIRWKNYDESHDTWEKRENLCCGKLLKSFLKSHKIK